MKVWFGYGSEHSANLVIIGTFASSEKAAESLRLLKEATNIARADNQAGNLPDTGAPDSFTKEMLEFLSNNNLSMSYSHPVELLYDFHAKQDDNRVVITTDETEIGVFISMLINKGGAKLEVYSAHDHGGPYGRQTKVG